MDSGLDDKVHTQGCVRWRYLTAVLAFFSIFSSYTMRSNISVAIVDMVKSNSSESSGQCPSDLYSSSQTASESGEFDWSKSTQGLVLSSFYWGYIVPQFAAGHLADKYGPKYVILVGGSLGSLMTLLAPIAAKVHVAFLVVTRIVCGVGLGSFVPCLHALIAKWTIRSERSFYTSFVMAGSHVGTVVSMAISGVLCSSKANWEWSFYLFGITSTVWVISWAILVYDTPKEHPWISLHELEVMEESLKEAVSFEKRPLVPWRKLLASKGIWALIIANFGNAWGFYTMFTELPTYMNDVLGFDMGDDGVYSAVPYVVAAVVGILSGFLADIILKKKILKILATRKLFTGLALYLSGGFLLIVTFITCQPMVTYSILVISIGISTLYYGGFLVNAIDIAPNFAGTIMGISTTAATIPGIVSPYLAGAITDVKPEDLSNAWSIVFYISFGVLYSSCTVYLIFAEGNILPWNDITNDAISGKMATGSVDRNSLSGKSLFVVYTVEPIKSM